MEGCRGESGTLGKCDQDCGRRWTSNTTEVLLRLRWNPGSPVVPVVTLTIVVWRQNVFVGYYSFNPINLSWYSTENDKIKVTLFSHLKYILVWILTKDKEVKLWFSQFRTYLVLVINLSSLKKGSGIVLRLKYQTSLIAVLLGKISTKKYSVFRLWKVS